MDTVSSQSLHGNNIMHMHKSHVHRIYIACVRKDDCSNIIICYEVVIKECYSCFNPNVLFNAQVNSYGHVETVIDSDTLFPGQAKTKQVTVLSSHSHHTFRF